MQAHAGGEFLHGRPHLSLLALGIGPGDEVITTPMTFIATADADPRGGRHAGLRRRGAGDGHIDPDRVEAAITPRTKAIMPVHLYGQMCDMRALRELRTGAA